MKTQDLEILMKISSSCHDMTEVVNNVEFEELFRNSETYNNCMFTLKQIGSYVTKLSPDFIEEYDDDFQWDKMARLKNIFEFFQTGYNRDTIWQIITMDIHELSDVTDEIYKKAYPNWLADVLTTS
jgi:uncharacterized protein with HEPN domain